MMGCGMAPGTSRMVLRKLKHGDRNAVVGEWENHIDEGSKIVRNLHTVGCNDHSRLVITFSWPLHRQSVLSSGRAMVLMKTDEDRNLLMLS